MFPENLNPEDFFKGEEHSILRNPLIAETMYKSEDIEKWASGLKRIHEECEASQVKVEFKRAKTGFVVCFFRPRWEEGEGLGGGQKRWSENDPKTVGRPRACKTESNHIQKRYFQKTRYQRIRRAKAFGYLKG